MISTPDFFLPALSFFFLPAWLQHWELLVWQSQASIESLLIVWRNCKVQFCKLNHKNTQNTHIYRVFDEYIIMQLPCDSKLELCNYWKLWDSCYTATLVIHVNSQACIETRKKFNRIELQCTFTEENVIAHMLWCTEEVQECLLKKRTQSSIFRFPDVMPCVQPVHELMNY